MAFEIHPLSFLMALFDRSHTFPISVLNHMYMFLYRAVSKMSPHVRITRVFQECYRVDMSVSAIGVVTNTFYRAVNTLLV